MLQDEKDILLHAIDNTEDVLLHRAWSEEAKQRVREARRAGRKVSEMFANLYSRTGRFINKSGKSAKRFANAVDSKYNISEHNGKTRKMLKNASQYPHKAELSGSGALRTIIKSHRAKGRQYGSVEATLKRMIPVHGRRERKKQIKDLNKFTNKNYNTIQKRIEGQKKINAQRERMQRRRIAGNYDSTTDSFITNKGNTTIYEDASGKGRVTISPRKRSKRSKRSH